jgi:hypothetical protein
MDSRLRWKSEMSRLLYSLLKLVIVELLPVGPVALITPLAHAVLSALALGSDARGYADHSRATYPCARPRSIEMLGGREGRCC